MPVWTYARLLQLRYRVADLRAALGDPNSAADPSLLAELGRQHAAANNLGEDPGYDPTYDPTHDPNRVPARDPARDPALDPAVDAVLEHGPEV
jgi:hypothetical protein